MTVRIFIILIIALSSCFTLSADSLTLVKKIDGKISFITTDHLGNCYFIIDNVLYKYELKSDSVFTYSDKNSGEIHFIDATDPFKILLFNKDFYRIQILDNKLSMQSAFNLQDLNLEQPVLICISRHDGYWIFDKQTNQLKKFDSSLQLKYESNDINRLVNSSLNPDFLIESDKWLWLLNPASGVLVFDMFGSYLKTISIADSINGFQIRDENIIYSTKNKLVEITQSGIIKSETIYDELTEVRSIRMEQNMLYVLKKESLEFYSF